MQFIYPYFLWALALLAIPIIIHLFYFRRFKKVYFSNVKFLQSVKEETAARSKLRNLLVLASRLLAFTCLVLAFALPFLHKENAQIGLKATSIFIDNSFSMEAKSSDVILLEKAKALARSVVQSHMDADLIQIITHDLEGKHNRMVDKEEALSMIDEIGITASVFPLSTIHQRISQTLAKANVDHKNIYWLTDFQRSISDLELTDSTINHFLLPVQSVEEGNLSIDSAWFQSPVAQLNEYNTIYVRVANHGHSTAENVRLSAIYQGEEKPISVIDLEPGQTHTDTFNLSLTNSGWGSVHLRLTDHPVIFDDNYYLSFEVKDQLKTTVLSDVSAPDFLKTALQSIEVFKPEFVITRQVDYSRLKEADLVILNEVESISSGLRSELVDYIKGGGNVLIFLPTDLSKEAYNDFLGAADAHRIQSLVTDKKEVTSINTDEFIFRDVFSRINSNVRLPSSTHSFKLDRAGRQAERLLTFRDGSDYLTKFGLDRGRLFLCTAPLARSINTLGSDGEIFVPMLHKMALSQSASKRMSYTIGKDRLIEVDGSLDHENGRLEIHGQRTFVPGINNLGQTTLLTIDDQIKKDGLYQLRNADSILYQLAFNYDRTESDLSYFSRSELEREYSGSAEVIEEIRTADLASFLRENREGKALWKWLLIFTLIFLAVEQLLLKYWKV